MGPIGMLRGLLGAADCDLGGAVVAEPDHLMFLYEQHEVSMPAPPTVDEGLRAQLISECQGIAQAWATDVGTEVECTPVDEHTAGERRIGVQFQVVVGKGVASPHAAAWRWRWSVRWRDWLTLFTSMNGPADLDAYRQEFVERLGPE